MKRHRLAACAALGVIFFAYAAIFLAETRHPGAELPAFQLIPPAGLMLQNLKLLLQGKGGYVSTLWGWLSFISFFALARRAGKAFLSFLKLNGQEASQPYLYGLIFICLAYVFIGFAGLIRPWVAWFLYAAGCGALLFDCARALRRPKETANALMAFRAWPIEKKFFAAWFFIWSFTALIIPTFTDFLQNQLGLPHFYMNEGGIVSNPYHVLSYFPQNCEMLLMHFVLLDSMAGLNLFLWSVWILAGLVVYEFAKFLTDEKSGWLAGAWLAVIPVFCWMYSNGKNDVLAMLYLVQGCFLLFAAANRPPEFKKLMLLSGLCIGMAVGTKYTIWIFMPAVLLYWAVNFAADSARLAHLALFASGAILSGGIWYVRNAAATLNPFYPLFGSVFPTKWIVPWHAHAEGASLISLGIIPAVKKLIIILAGFAPDLGHLSPASASLTPFQWGVTLPLLLFIVPGIRYARKQWAWLIFFGLCGLGAMLFLEPALRYFPALIAFFCVASIVSLHHFSLSHGAWIRNFAAALILLSIFSPTSIGNLRALAFGAIPLLLSGVDPLTQATFKSGVRYPVDPQNLLLMGRHMNESLPQDARVLIIGDERPPLLRRRYLVQTDQPREIIDDWFMQENSLEGLKRKLKAEGITHLLVNTNYFQPEVIYTAPVPRVAGEIHRSALPAVTQFLRQSCVQLASAADKKLLLFAVQ